MCLLRQILQGIGWTKVNSRTRIGSSRQQSTSDDNLQENAGTGRQTSRRQERNQEGSKPYLSPILGAEIQISKMQARARRWQTTIDGRKGFPCRRRRRTEEQLGEREREGVAGWWVGALRRDMERKEGEEGICEGEVLPRLWGRKRHVNRVHGPTCVSCDDGFRFFFFCFGWS